MNKIIKCSPGTWSYKKIQKNEHAEINIVDWGDCNSVNYGDIRCVNRSNAGHKSAIYVPANMTLMAASKELVRQLANEVLICMNCTLEAMNERNYSKNDYSRVMLDMREQHKDSIKAIAKAFTLKPEELTLTVLREISTMEMS